MPDPLLEDNLELQRATEARRRSDARMATVNHAMARFLESGDCRAAVAVLLQHLRSQTGCEAALAGRLTEDGEQLEVCLLAQEGVAPSSCRMPLRGTLLGQTMARGVPLLESDRCEVLSSGLPTLRQYLGVPVTLGPEVVGVLALVNRPDGFGDADVVELELMAHTVSVLYDSERRRQRQQVLERQLVQAQKMEAIGRLAGGVAHDFNNFLTCVRGNAELALEELGPGHAATENLRDIMGASERAAALTRQLLAFSRRAAAAPEWTDLNATLHAVGELLQRAVGHDVAVSINAGHGLWGVVVDPGQIEQVVMNLVVNARDAMPSGGRIGISTANVELDEGSYVRLSVADSGTGMEPQVVSHVFDPFFTTKGSHGTGLGLSTAHGIVGQSGGHIQVESMVGRGSTFHVFLPRAAPPPPSLGRLASRETILLVEDSEVVRNLTRRMLLRHGYRVLEAADGEIAYGVAQAWPGPIHLLLTDVEMPGSSGPALAERLVAARPGLEVIYASGRPQEALAREGRFLQKPFSSTVLLRKVREILAGGAAATA